MSSSSSTEPSTGPSQSSPMKRRRMPWDHSDNDDQFHHATPSKPYKGSSQPPLSQSAEEAILEDWGEDIEDFDDSAENANFVNNMSANKKGKFVSFGAAGPPTTPKKEQEEVFESAAGPTPRTPQRLAPGLPVTPASVEKQGLGARAAGVAVDKWQEILNDPSSPFHARRNALLGENCSPTSTGTAPLLGSGRTDTSPLAPGSTYSSHVRSVSNLVTHFAATVQDELSTAGRSADTLERQLKAAQAKAAYHEKKEKESRKEMEEIKEQLRSAKKENEQLRLGWN